MFLKFVQYLYILMKQLFNFHFIETTNFNNKVVIQTFVIENISLLKFIYADVVDIMYQR